MQRDATEFNGNRFFFGSARRYGHRVNRRGCSGFLMAHIGSCRVRPSTHTHAGMPSAAVRPEVVPGMLALCSAVVDCGQGHAWPLASKHGGILRERRGANELARAAAQRLSWPLSLTAKN
ncbi:hypothetical protein MRX96_055042 [Rhipicephalus microplus]